MNHDYMDFEMDDWDDSEEDEVLYESDEFKEQTGQRERESQESIISDDLPVLPLRGVVVYPMMWLPLPIEPIGEVRSAVISFSSREAAVRLRLLM